MQSLANATRTGANRKPSRRNEDGATVVEAALVMPILLLIIFAFFEFGPLFRQWSAVKNSANNAARIASTAGTEVTADYDIVRAVRNLPTDRRYFNYLIVFRTSDIKRGVPGECLQQARLHQFASTNEPVGAFQATAADPVITDFRSEAMENHNWDTPPLMACSVYYARSFDLPEANFIYNKALALANPTTSRQYSMNRFWPSQNRVDFMSGPQDYVGLYVETNYPGVTGIVRPRQISETSIYQIEPKRYSRNGGA
jgi:Flp pilus assembly protein TadG